MSNLTTLTDRVEQVLADTANAIWSTTWIEEGLRQALNEYSLAKPARDFDSFALTGMLSTNKREIDLSGWTEIADVLDVTRVWLPYDVSKAAHTPRRFEFWRDKQVLHFVDSAIEPSESDMVRIFFTRPRTINGLDSATATTVYGEHETTLVTGAAGHVAASRGLDLTEQVTIDKLTANQVRAWGLSKLQEFRAALRSISRQSLGAARVKLSDLDKWDKGWS